MADTAEPPGAADGLSHLTFYDSVPARQSGPPSSEVPEPGTLLTIALGLLVLIGGPVCGVDPCALGARTFAKAVAEVGGRFYGSPSNSHCPGFFSTDSGFSSCQIFWDPTDQDGETTIELSPIIAQFDSNFTVSDINTVFDTVDGSEWTITSSATGEGTWEYNPDALDPGIRYWSAFGGNAFKLFWEVSDDAATSGACSDTNSVFNLDWLNEALVVEAGDWSTPINPNGGQLFELSHLTFYGIDVPMNAPHRRKNFRCRARWCC